MHLSLFKVFWGITLIFVVQWTKNVENSNNILNVRGCNYETVTHQLMKIAENIVNNYGNSINENNPTFW